MGQTSLLLFRAFERLVRRLKRVSVKPRTYAANIISVDTGRKIAALSYIGEHVAIGHTNSLQQAEIIFELNSLGYEVDVWSNDAHPRIRRNYDLIVGFGYCWRQLCQLSPAAKKVLYLTEAPPFASYIREKFAQKRFVSHVSRLRTYRFYLDDDCVIADELWQMGARNAKLLDVLLMDIGPPVKRISTYGIGHGRSTAKKSFGKTFIWFGSSGIVLKGLSHAIEAIRELPDAHLMVAGCPRREFDSLQNLPSNVSYVGILDVNSDAGLKTLDEASFFILPTYSEGISTAAITCMYRGLFPLVTAAANVEIPGGRYVSPCKESLLTRMREVLSMSTEDLLIVSEEVRRRAIAEYSPQSFKESIRRAIGG